MVRALLPVMRAFAGKIGDPHRRLPMVGYGSGYSSSPGPSELTSQICSRRHIAEAEFSDFAVAWVTIHQTTEVIESGGKTRLSARDASRHWTRC